LRSSQYIGTLVVFEKTKNGTTIYETIDGQQRLTTLSILLSVLKNYFNVKIKFKALLRFESRETSTKTLEEIYSNNGFSDDSNPTMKNAYEIIKKSKRVADKDERDSFVKYLLNYVEILRVCVPEDTDLNHYFEIMNNRGEQLEKHEVLKAQMMSKLEKKDSLVFSKIWEACSDMSRYVQYGFNTADRKIIFGNDWNNFEKGKFDDILPTDDNIDNTDKTNNNQSLGFEDIIKQANNGTNEINTNESPERFTSPVNFQNFLLHVLRIQEQKKDKDIPLDDKRLIDAFSSYLNTENSAKFVKSFGFNLLKTKYLFDNYILKRDYTKNSEDGEWSLKKLQKYASGNKETGSYINSFDELSNKKLVMLLSMFHVSNPSQNYKHWLTGVLNFLMSRNNDIQAQKYIEYLEKQAKLFLMNRYLVSVPTDYQDIIFKDKLAINQNINSDLLNNGTNVENFIFNYLDYLLWLKDNKKIFDQFTFTFRSSVEHFYPQHPLDGQDQLDDETLNSFGNLCLISASKNSKLTNLQPEGKKSHYHGFDGVSPKQFLMMEKAHSWDINAINVHKIEMIKILIDNLFPEGIDA
jgi:uncharacterized protein with ParB-like and HNH nuclease domain